MKLRKHLLRDFLLSLLIAVAITVINRNFLITSNNVAEIPLFFSFWVYSLFFVTSVSDFITKRVPKKLSASYIALSIDLLVVLESGGVAFQRPEKDIISWIALFACMISFVILFIFLIVGKNLEEKYTK